MASFYERPILNSPYRAPELHHPLDRNGQPLEGEPRQGRRPSRFIVPVPASRKKASTGQASLDLETYTENALINEIRGYVRDTDGLEDERRGIISVFDGPAPEVRSLADLATEAATVRQAVETWLGEGIAPHEIGLFVRTPQLVTRARAAIAGLTGEGEMTTAPMSLAKGLEFRAVVVMACDEGILPLDERVADAADEAELDDIYETERRLLYVACTRAREHLLLTGVTPTSEYLADFTSKAATAPARRAAMPRE